MMNKVTARAHGRVNLIGEHTDYNGGWVLPTTIPQYTEVSLEATSGSDVRLISSHERESHYTLGRESKTDSWVDYLQGATKFLLEKGHVLSGFSAHISSTIPEGSGLSSSAALEMSFLIAINKLFNLNLSEIELAKLGQKIENDFVGAKVGIMDQMATSLAREGEALFIDTRSLAYERIPLPLDQMDLMVINSGISHRLSSSDGGYNERRSQCEEACRLLNLGQLRELTISQLKSIDLPELLIKRVRHVVTENERVKEAVKALRMKDIPYLGKLFIESHKSMRDDYQVSIPEIDLLVDLCLSEKGVWGARLTGGGFGGSIVAIIEKGLKTTLAQKVLRSYQEKTGEKGALLA